MLKLSVIAATALVLVIGLSAGGMVVLERHAAAKAWDEACPIDDFDFVFGYGAYAAHNVLDTTEGTFTRHIEPVVTVPLELTSKEMNDIHSKVGAIGFFDYPDVYHVELFQTSHTVITPNPYWYLKVACGEEVKELRWNDAVVEPVPAEARRLRELFKLVREAIETKEAYQTLPPQRFLLL